MKKLKFIAIMMILAGSFSCQKEGDPLHEETDFYYGKEEGEGHNHRIYFTVRKDKLIVKCESETDAKALTKQAIFSSAYELDYWVLGTIDPKKTKLDDLLKMPKVVSATYGLDDSKGSFYYPTDRIAVKLKDEYTLEEVIDTIGLSKHIVAIDLFDPHSEVYVITFDVKLGDILRISCMLFETELCEFAAPSFIMELKHPNPNINH